MEQASTAPARISTDVLSPPDVRAARITYTLIFDDVKEGLQALEKTALSPSVRHAMSIITWIFCLVLLGVAYFFSEVTSRAARSAGVPNSGPSADFWLALLPSALAAGVVMIVIMAARLRVFFFRLLRSRRAQQWRVLVSVGALLLVYACWPFVVGFLMDSTRVARWPVTRFQAILLAFAPWFVLPLLNRVLFLTMRRRRLAIQWKNSPPFHRQHTVEIDANGITSEDEVVRHDYRWTYFKHARETPRLFVLLDELGRRHMLPKRAFTTPEDLQTAMSLIATHIADSKFLTRPRGFDVAAPAGNEPLPVLPIETPAGESSA